MKRLDRSKTLPSLEDGLVGDAELQDAVRNMKVARLTEDDGSVRVGLFDDFEYDLNMIMCR